ncbi:MAG: hypothetical protein IPG63_15380 [Xanthomonadales bacterium]|nr:hypothetical protein [Xanthomonadales bacterium]
MARPRKPTSLLAINGTLAKNPGRYADRASEPVDDRALGPPPDTMRPDQRAAWLEIERLAPWLRFGDRIAVEVTAALLATFRVGGVGMMPPAMLTRLETMLARLGMTPADRSRVAAGIGSSGADNPFSALKRKPIG